MTTTPTPILPAPFHGIVYLREPYQRPDNRWVYGVAGTVSLLTQAQFGIDKGAGETWALKVEAPNNLERFVIVLGCQIRSVEAIPAAEVVAGPNLETLGAGGR